MKLPLRVLRATVFLILILDGAAPRAQHGPAGFRAGVAAVPITPYGKNPDWKGGITPTGVWGEAFEDKNGNGRWDPGEPFTDDPANTALDPHSKGKYDGVYLAGFGNDRLAKGRHDDLWARTLVLEKGGQRIAIVAVDLIGYYSKAGYYGIDAIRAQLDPALNITDVLVASTHNHEGPDTIGLWGESAGSDGKYPEYLQFVDREIAKSIVQATRSLAPARMRIGSTNPQVSPALAKMQTRTDGRPPGFFDEQLRVIQFLAAEPAVQDHVIATLINWNTHPESMEDENAILTSDFPGALREAVEKKYGGTAVYISGDLGAVEIVGDNNRSTRNEFDGRKFPVVPGNKAKMFTLERTEAIGREVSKAVFDAVARSEASDPSNFEVKKAELRVPMDNDGYKFLLQAGVLSTLRDSPGEVVSTVYAIRLGDAQILTAPGELFPEVFYGVAANRRTNCPAADTGHPAEPAVRDAMTAKYKFIFGLTPDEFGYLVPGYDFHRPAFDPEKGFTEAKDACSAKKVPAHYHETNSASSNLAPSWACVAMQLLTGKESQSEACVRLRKELSRTPPAAK